MEFNIPNSKLSARDNNKDDNGPAVRIRTTSGRPPRQRENKNTELSDTISNPADTKLPET